MNKNMPRFLLLALSFLYAPLTTLAAPLSVHPTNPRYFTDGSGKAIYMTGHHTWGILVDRGPKSPPPPFDYNEYLNELVTYNHNFLRMWAMELTRQDNSTGTHFFSPQPYARTGPGTALDGLPKFDLNTFNQSYFDRLRNRVIQARNKGIYVDIMFFEGWGIQFSKRPWRWDAHPFNVRNNVNGIDGNPDRDSYGTEIHTLQIPAVTSIQKSYIKKVIDTVNDLDNVLYEIVNEAGSYSINWQYEMINYVKTYQATQPNQHPVGMNTVQSVGNSPIFASAADWVSPTSAKWGDPTDPYANDPPAADGSKVIILDNDHIGIGIFKNDPSFARAWVWKSFTRGHQPIWMDLLTGGTGTEAAWLAMGRTRAYAEKIGLAGMTPQKSLSSTKYILANPGNEYLVYQPKSRSSFTVKLKAGTYNYEWYDPTTGEVTRTGSVTSSGGNKSFTAPFSGDSVLYLKSQL